ncbi:MAG: HD-GYP domain-containing protein [Phycisphaerae bacterium]
MQHEGSSSSTASQTPADHNLPALLERLRARVAVNTSDAELDRLLSAVSEAADRIVCEQKGMVEELLGTYEQLGVVFELTQKLSTVQRESEMVSLFVDGLRRSLSARGVSVVQRLDQHGWVLREADIAIEGWVEAALERAHDEKAVVVEQAPEGETHGRIAEIMVGPIFAGEAFVCAILLTRGTSVHAFCSSDMLLLESLTTFCGDLIRIHRLGHELRDMSLATVLSLVNAVDQKDQYTSGHSLRVGYYATLLGRSLGLGVQELQMLQWSALLHDVGKIGIRDEVLKKQGKLTKEEMDHIKEHPVRSFIVVRQVPQLADALAGVHYHHEHYDGSGYPEGLVGEEIPLQARIIQIADVFDALTSSRSYRRAYDWSTALAVMESEAGKTVDPHLQRVFADLIREECADDPNAWDRLVRTAERFTQSAVCETLHAEGC